MGKFKHLILRIIKKLSCVAASDNDKREGTGKKSDSIRAAATILLKTVITDDDQNQLVESSCPNYYFHIWGSNGELTIKTSNKTYDETGQRKNGDNLRYRNEWDNDRMSCGCYSANTSTQTDELPIDSNLCKVMAEHSSQISTSSGYKSKSALSLDMENCLASLLQDDKSHKLYEPEIVPESIQKTHCLDRLSAASTESLNIRDPTIWISRGQLLGESSSLSFLSDDCPQSFVGMDDFNNIRDREVGFKDLRKLHISQQLGAHYIPCRLLSSSTSDLMCTRLNSSTSLISLSSTGMLRHNKATRSHSSFVSFCTEQPCENVCAESLLDLHTDTISLARAELQFCSLDSGSIHQDISSDFNSSSNNAENGSNSNEENLGREESKPYMEIDAENDLKFSKRYLERTCQSKEACLQSLESDSDLFGESANATNTTDGHSFLADPARSFDPGETDLNEKSSSAGDVTIEYTVSGDENTCLLTRESSRENFFLKGDDDHNSGSNVTVDLNNLEKMTTKATEENILCDSLIKWWEEIRTRRIYFINQHGIFFIQTLEWGDQTEKCTQERNCTLHAEKISESWNLHTNCDLKNAKGINLTFPKSKHEPINFDVRETMWICFLDEVNGKHCVSELHFFLLRFCPWLVNSKQRHVFNENSKTASHLLGFVMCTPSLKKEFNNKCLSLKDSWEQGLEPDTKDENMSGGASDEDENSSPTRSLRVEMIPNIKDANISLSASFHEKIVKANVRDENKEGMNPETENENVSTTTSSEEKIMKPDTLKDKNTCMPNMASLKEEIKPDTENKSKNKRNHDTKVENVSIMASFSGNRWVSLCKKEVGKEKKRFRISEKRRHSCSVNSLMTEPCNEKPFQQNTDSKTSAETNYRMVMSLQHNGIKENITNSRFKSECKLTDTRKQKIRRIALRYLERFDTKRQRTSLSTPFLSYEKFEHLSLPEMIYRLNAIPKGLTALRRYLRVSNDFRITSVDFITVPLQQSAQQTQGSTNQLDEPNMDSEWSRFTTFQNYPASVGVSAVKLAKHGFYYTGNGTETRCQFCSGTYSEWNSTSDVETIHQQISPDCPLANGRQTNNVPIHNSRNLPLSHVDIFRRRTNEGSTRDPTAADSTAQGQTEQAEAADPTAQGQIEQAKAADPTAQGQTEQAKAGDPTAQGQTEQAKAGDPTAEGQTEQTEAGDPTAQGQTDQAKAGDPTAQGQTEQAEASQEDKDSIQSTDVTSSPQVMSKSKLKREKKKKKKEAQAKTKAESISSQGVSGPGRESLSLTQSASSSSSISPGLAIEEVQYNPHETEAGRATRQGFSSESGATSNSTDSHLLKSGPKDHKNTHTSSSNVSKKSQSDVGAGGQLRGGGRAPESEERGTSLNGQQHGANPPSSTPGSVEAASTSGPSPSERLAQLDPLGINFDRPKYPAYAVYSTRLSSFDGWPSHMAQTPREMARAGYFYAGYGDYARCFFCGGGLRNWDRSDDPWTEHARWFPRCAFLRNNRGNKFVATVQRTHEEQEAGLRPSARFLNPPERDMDTPAAEALREAGYSDRVIEQAIDQWRRSFWPGRIQPPPLSAERLLDMIEDIERAEEGRPAERPLTIPGVHDETVESRATGCNVEDSAVTGTTTRQSEEDSAVALEENRSDDQPVQAEPRDYGYDQKDKQEKQVLEEDYLGLRETLACKICRERDVAAAFLPCGHLVCCLDCAPAMRKCPTCGEVIKGTVKTYFA